MIGVRACLRVERLPAGAGDLPARIGQIQFVQPIGGADFELGPGVELPVDDVALPQIEFDQRADVE
jgi:hypothetical protein